MNSNFTLIGGIMISNNNKNETPFPALLIPVFKKGNNYYTQVAKRASHPYTYYEDVVFQTVSPSYFNQEIASSEDFIDFENKNEKIDFSKKVYMYALSRNTLFAGNLLDFAKQINNLKLKSPEVLNTKEYFTKRARLYEKTGLTFQNEEIQKYIEEKNFTL